MPTTPSTSTSDYALVLAGRPMPAEDQRVLTAFAAQVAVAYRQRELSEAASAVEPLAESERARTALLNAVSHDLRTPIASAKAAVSSLLSADVSWSEQDRAELLAAADDSLDRLTDLVTNLLDLSRLQAGVLPVLTAPVGLDDVVARALDHAAPPGAPVVTDVPGDLPAVAADAGLLERVVANLVQNALRYSPAGVRITGSTLGDYAELRVDRLRTWHSGRGPRRRVRRRSSARTTRRPTARRSASGLAIARGFTEAMGGSRDRRGHARRGRDAGRPVGAGMTRVLVVEDERALLRALAMNLTARGYDVTEAADGTSALAAAASVEPDVILLDLGLPDISGLDVIRGVRAYATTPIVVLSARTGSTDKVVALDLGADDYVTKPFNIDELLARLRAATRRGGTAVAPEVVRFGDTVVDLDAKTATRSDDPVHLTRTEWQLLEALLHRPGKLVTTRALLTELRGSPEHTDPSYLRIFIRPAAGEARTRPEPPAPPDHRAWHGLPLPPLTSCPRAAPRAGQSRDLSTSKSPSAKRARSTFLSNLPTEVLGTSSMNAQFSGICQLATLPSR